MKNVLIIAFSDLQDDPRVFRQIDHLRKFYKITTVGWTPAQLDDVEFIPIEAIPRSGIQRALRAVQYKLRRFEKIYWSIYDFPPVIETLLKRKFDLILVNDVDALPFALEIAGQAKVLLDLHEYTPKHFEDQLIWRFFFQPFNQYLCDKYLPGCNGFMTVSSGIANEFKKSHNIYSHVVTNAVKGVSLAPSPVDREKIRIINHGVAHPYRRLESMITIMDHIDSRFHLDIMLLPVVPRYYKKLQAMADKRPNVSMLPAVEREEIVPSTNNHDLSFIIFKPYTINYKYGLGNKTFQSLQARLAIVTGQTPTPQAEIVNKYHCGVVLDSFEPQKIARQLNRLTTEQITQFKQNANVAALELTMEKNMEKLHDIVEHMLNP